MPELSYEAGETVTYLTILFAGPTGKRLFMRKSKGKLIWLGYCYEELVGGIDDRTIKELIRGN